MAISAVNHKLAFVDLSSGRVDIEDVPDEPYEKYLGGYGLGAYVLYTRQEPKVDPLGPRNMLGLLTGPLTGTDAITGNRFAVVSKSPKTGTWGDANCGGTFGPALKMAGLDGIFFTGISPEPVVAVVADGEVRLEPAGHAWGMDSEQTEDELKARYGRDCRIACIGPAGERVSLLAAVMNDGGRAAGRSGLGTVMGSKRLKAVVAQSGDGVQVADPEGLRALRREILQEYYRPGNDTYELFSNYGTCGIMASTVESGDGPTKNWTGTYEDFKTADRVSDDAVIALQERKYGCWHCPLACGGHVKVTAGPYAGEKGHKPEYETLGVFGSMCLNDNLASIVRCNNICNRSGMDTISVGATVAFAIECFERGIITKEDTGGHELTWGNHEAITKVTEEIATGTGFGGRVLGDGIKAAVSRLGPAAEVAAMHIAGEELPMHDPRCNPGLTCSWVVDATPGRHTQYGSWLAECDFVPPDLGAPEIEDKYAHGAKGETARYITNFGHVVNAAGLCMFGCTVTPGSAVAKFLSLAMGKPITMADVQEIGARIAALRMAFNAREGIRNTDFKLPRRVLGDPPLAVGPTAGITVDGEAEVKAYLEAAGWDTETAVPKKETLRELGLDFVMSDLYG